MYLDLQEYRDVKPSVARSLPAVAPVTAPVTVPAVAPEADPVFTIANFRSWLAARPSGRTYDFRNPLECPLARYFSDHGYRDVNMWDHSDCTRREPGRQVHGGGDLPAHAAGVHQHRFQLPVDLWGSVRARPRLSLIFENAGRVPP